VSGTVQDFEVGAVVDQYLNDSSPAIICSGHNRREAYWFGAHDIEVCTKFDQQLDDLDKPQTASEGQWT
jgi:hypothetical protein